MKEKIIFLSALSVFVLLILSLPTFAQYKYTQSKTITCGNGVCESSFNTLQVGETKTIEISGKTYTFKVINIEKKEFQAKSLKPECTEEAKEGKVTPQTRPECFKEETSYTYNLYLSINGGPSLLSREAIEKSDIRFDASAVDENTAMLNFYEDKICAVPDCAFRVELNLFKKWNLVPLFFIEEGGTSSSVSEVLKKGTCKLQDFLVIYGYDSIKKDYVQLYSYGKSVSDLSSSFSNFGNLGSTEKIIVGSPFNSVWVYSLNDCKLVAEVTKEYENLLLFLEQAKAKTNFYFASGWNFWTGSKDMEGKSFDEIKDDCKIEKTYTFEAQSQSWKKLETSPGPSVNLVFKVKDPCMFGIAETPIPQLPK